MSALKLIDIDSPTTKNPKKVFGEENLGADDEDTEEVPVHLFISPTHSKGSNVSSPQGTHKRRRPPLRETTFVTIEKQHASDASDREDVISPLSSPTMTSSGRDEMSSPTTVTRLPVRRTNKIYDVERTPMARVVIKEDNVRRRSDDSPRDFDGVRSVTSMSDHVSDHLSYKDRLRDHFITMREKAAESLSRPQSRSQSRSQSRMKVLLANRPQRPDEALKREERDIALALDKHHKLREQWRQLSEELVRKQTENEGYEFYTQEVTGVDNPLADSELPVSPCSSAKSVDAKATAADVLGLKENWEPVVWAPARLAKTVADKLRDIIWYPASKTVPRTDKLEEGSQPRFLEEEGLYVGNVNSRPRRMKNRLEQRLLRSEDGKKWFGPDGELLGRPCSIEFSLEIHQAPDNGNRTFYQFPLLPSKSSGLDEVQMVLDLELIAVRFNHHSLFSREHVIAQRLHDIWRLYRQTRQSDHCRRLRGQLDAMRRARVTSDFNHAKRLDHDITTTRDRWFKEGAIERRLEARLISTWRDLTRMREEQGYRNTGIQLTTRHKTLVTAADWERELLEEISSSCTDAQKRYDLSRKEYESQLEEWRVKLSNNADLEIAEDEPPPTAPTPVDPATIKHEVTEYFQSSFRGPGEPIMEISIRELGPPTAAVGDAKEESRRSAVQRQKLMVKLLYNSKEVCQSYDQQLSQKFSVKFCQRFAVRLQEMPHSLSLDLVETGRETRRIYLPLPDGLATVAGTDVVLHEFSSAEIVSHSNSAVGSGKEIVACPGSSDNNRPISLNTAGTVAYRLGWAVDASGKILSPPKQFMTLLRKDKEGLTSKFRPDVAKLRDWAEDARLDPHDPRNTDLFDWLNQSESVTAEPLANENELDFCDAAELDNNPRLRLLRLRDQGEPEFRGYQMVPLSEKLIHPDVFKAYEARVARPIEQELVVDPLDSHRLWGRRKLEQVRQEVLQRCRQARQHRRLADVVTEDQVPDLGTLGLTLMQWLKPKRPLRPERKQRKKVPVQNLIGQDVNIVVNVVRAFEVPVRKDVDTMSTTGSIEGFSLVNVRPFVSASFRGFSARTTAAEGANPTWNQHLVLPVRTSTGDFSPGVLAGIRDTLYLHLFDEVVVDLIEEDGDRDTVIHQRLERHWLAGLEIPFSTLYCNSRVEGTFQLYSPPVVLGYEREAHRVITSGSLPQRDATYITLFITVQPSLNPPEPFQDFFASTETPELDRHLRGWAAEVCSMFPGRKMRFLVSTAAGNSVCVTRFLRPIAPPNLGSEMTSPAAAARFVSKIPAMSSATFFPGLLDVWLTCDQVISLLIGDVADHAVLLCCFLLHLGQPAYLLLGVGIPHGGTAYVLINSPSNEVVWDPISGTKYSVRDSFCPLQKVYCLVTNTNIWANIQEDECPRRVRYDITKRADWLPAFNKNMDAPTESVQPESLNFKETSRQAVQAMQDKLESRLRDGVMRWRRRQRTQWNRYCAATMRKLLPCLEEATWDVEDPVSPNHWQGLNHILSSHKICGFPINMAYTDIDTIMEAVKATGVHTNDNAEVEFALAVYIYPYPCDILSVWVYVASLTRRR